MERQPLQQPDFHYRLLVGRDLFRVGWADCFVYWMPDMTPATWTAAVTEALWLVAAIALAYCICGGVR